MRRSAPSYTTNAPPPLRIPNTQHRRSMSDPDEPMSADNRLSCECLAILGMFLLAACGSSISVFWAQGAAVGSCAHALHFSISRSSLSAWMDDIGCGLTCAVLGSDAVQLHCAVRQHAHSVRPGIAASPGAPPCDLRCSDSLDCGDAAQGPWADNHQRRGQVGPLGWKRSSKELSVDRLNRCLDAGVGPRDVG